MPPGAVPLSMKELNRAATLREWLRNRPVCPSLTVGARIAAIFIR